MTSSSNRYAAVGLAGSTFALLVLELAVIRWIPGQVRLFAYFSNLVLIASFLGMGLGLVLGRRHAQLRHYACGALALLVGVLSFSVQLGFSEMPFPDISIAMWGTETAVKKVGQAFGSLAMVLAIFWSIVAVFICAGAAVAYYFDQLETLKAYSLDLIGSLLGVIAFAAMTAIYLPPTGWFAVGCVPLLAISRRWHGFVAAACVVGCGIWSASGAHFSPYNRIEVQADGSNYQVRVNRDFHQYMYDFSEATVASSDVEDRGALLHGRRAYDIPFVLNRVRRSALVVGGGTGNDVQSALRNGYESVMSVDIDARIIDIGRKMHPEKPYDDPRVFPIINDARAFFEQYAGRPFDVVCYGLLDSHSMFSAMSSLRLENYVYTKQGLASAWRLVAPEGHLSLSFSVFGGEWISDRIYWTLYEATGERPVMIHHGMHFGRTFVVAKPKAQMSLAEVGSFPVFNQPHQGRARVRVTTDDWPFLYLRPDATPTAYIGLLGVILLTAFVSVRRAYRRAFVAEGFDVTLFLMGAAFLLLETRGVTSLSLLFGSTWVVNAAVFSGILSTVLMANMAVLRFGLRRQEPWFVALVLSLAILWFVPVGELNQWSLLVRGVLGGLLVGVPVGIAGVIVSIRLAQSTRPTAALGANLMGSVVGGCLEYSSMLVGLRALVGLAMVLYLAAWLATRASAFRTWNGDTSAA